MRPIGSRRANVYAVVVLAAAALGVPSLGLASSGGSSVQPPAGSGSTGGPGDLVAPGNLTVTASGNGITVTTRTTALLHGLLRFTGSVASAPGATVEIERLGRETGSAWSPTAHATIAQNGTFSVSWRVNHIGRFAIRALLVQGAGSRTGAASPNLTVTLYRPSIATTFGPGFYGQRTACGQTLRRNTIGLANRTLKCGTPVGIYYQGRTLVVPVIDRGPYANGADWDLTVATAHLLAIDGTVDLGAVSLPPNS
ncbi:MAG: hypothetical protein JO169_07550 [Solirubrobacterales bacterium]|nr:hypothetical protein [Solirubrobacterales bacterium]